LAPLAEEVFCKSPTSAAGPIYTFAAPMIDKHGGVLYTECRWQGFYDWQGTISWGVSILDRWSESHHWPALPRPAAQEEVAPASQPHHPHADPTPAHHHDPNSLLDHHTPPTLDDLLYAHFFQDPPPT
jgi:hypothetical protein